MHMMAGSRHALTLRSKVKVTGLQNVHAANVGMHFDMLRFALNKMSMRDVNMVCGGATFFTISPLDLEDFIDCFWGFYRLTLNEKYSSQKPTSERVHTLLCGTWTYINYTRLLLYVICCLSKRHHYNRLLHWIEIIYTMTLIEFTVQKFCINRIWYTILP